MCVRCVLWGDEATSNPECRGEESNNRESGARRSEVCRRLL